MHVRTCAYVCRGGVCVGCIHICMHVEAKGEHWECLPQLLPSLFFEIRSLTNPISGKLADNFSGATCLPVRHWVIGMLSNVWFTEVMEF